MSFPSFPAHGEIVFPYVLEFRKGQVNVDGSDRLHFQAEALNQGASLLPPDPLPACLSK